MSEDFFSLLLLLGSFSVVAFLSFLFLWGGLNILEGMVERKCNFKKIVKGTLFLAPLPIAALILILFEYKIAVF